MVLVTRKSIRVTAPTTLLALCVGSVPVVVPALVDGVYATEDEIVLLGGEEMTTTELDTEVFAGAIEIVTGAVEATEVRDITCTAFELEELL